MSCVESDSQGRILNRQLAAFFEFLVTEFTFSIRIFENQFESFNQI